MMDALGFMKWKYQVITEAELRRLVDDGHPFTSVYEQEALRKCGELGWELVQILVGNDGKVYYFKQATP